MRTALSRDEPELPLMLDNNTVLQQVNINPHFLSTQKSAEMQYRILEVTKFLGLPTFQDVGSQN